MKLNLEKIEIRIPPQRFAQEPANIEKGIYDKSFNGPSLKVKK